MTRAAIADTLTPLRLAPPRVFANPRCVTPSWYIACRSKRLGRRRPTAFTVLDRRFVAWRDADGTAHSAPSRCPHLGADLSQGEVDAGRLRCPFHHWSFDSTGECAHAPGHDPAPDRCLRVLPTIERYGFVWTYLGGEPVFDLPDIPDSNDYRIVRPPAQLIAAHPHLVIGNGLDLTHFESLHGMAFNEPPSLDPVDDHTLTVRLRGRPASNTVRWLTGTRRRDIDATFTTIGGNVGLSSVLTPLRFYVLFTARPDPDGHALTQTIWFLPRGWGPAKVRAVLLMGSMLHDDQRVLAGLDFHPSFTSTDEPLRRFAELIDRLGAA